MMFIDMDFGSSLCPNALAMHGNSGKACGNYDKLHTPCQDTFMDCPGDRYLSSATSTRLIQSISTAAETTKSSLTFTNYFLDHQLFTKSAMVSVCVKEIEK